MTCDRFRDYLSADLDGEAAVKERGALQRHLATCSDCRRARDAAYALRQRLLHAAAHRPGDGARDEQILQALHRAGLCRERMSVDASRPWSWALLTRRLSLLSVVLSGTLRGLPSPRPALAVMAASFLLTWGSLRWAEMRPSGMSPLLSSSTAAVPARPGATPRAITDLEAEVVEQWLAESPTLGALARLQRLPAPTPPRPAPAERGEIAVPRRRVG